MELTISFDGDKALAAQLRALGGPQMRQAHADALNTVAFNIRRDMQAEMRSVFDRPTTWITGSPWIIQATPDKPSAAILPTRRRDSPAGVRGGKAGVDPQDVLQAQEWGGTRRDKKSEAVLRRAGLLPAGMQTAIPERPYPGSDDGRGNLRGAFLQQLLSYLQLFSEQGYHANMSAKRKAAIHQGSARASGRRYFVSYGRLRGNRSSHLAPGIWAASGTHGVDVRPVLMFVKQPSYQPRISMDRIAAQRDRRAQFEKQFEYRIGRLLAEAGA